MSLTALKIEDLPHYTYDDYVQKNNMGKRKTFVMGK